MKELAPPPQAKTDNSAVEVLRAWVIDKGLQCSVNIGGFGEEEVVVWGILLSDVARHIADAMEKMKGTPRKETIEAIQKHFNFELDTPTGPASGGLLEQ
jgi:hypothetical protein